MKIIFINLLLLISINILSGQNTGIYPPIHKWKQINTDTVRLIFPEGMEEKAQRVSFLTHQLAKTDTLSFGVTPGKVNIFLMNQTAESNGYIAFAPFHGKLFSTAPQYAFAGTVDWFDLLTIHEYRHVMQMNGSRRGFTGLIRKVLGETFWAGALVLNTPSWFIEGDAVMQETKFSYSGRGRVPEFKMRFNSIANQDKPFSYEKMRCGSYRDYIPDDYALGYRLIEYGVNNYGIDLWNKVYRESITYKNLFYPFSRALKKHTGLNTPKFYQQALNAKRIIDIRDQGEILDNEKIVRIGKELEFYSAPKFSDSSLYVIKSSFSSAPHIIKIDPKNPAKVQKILPVGYGFGKYDVSDNFIVWDEINEDKRWSGVSYSNIYKYNFKLDNTIQISRNKKYFSPSLSPDDKKIAVIEADANADYRIVILDFNTGKEIGMIPNPQNYFFRETRWIDDETIVVIAARENVNSLMSVSLTSNQYTGLIPGIVSSVSDLDVSNGKIFFTSFLDGESNVQELFCYDLKSCRLYRKNKVSKYGQLMPAYSENGIFVYCEKDFNKTGLVISNEPWVKVFEPDTNLLQCTKENISEPNILENVQSGKYPVKDYRSHYKLINFHSWIPLYLHPFVSATFLSSDYLDRLQLSISPRYNLNDRSFSLLTELEYGEFYPVITVEMDNIFNQEDSFKNNSTGAIEKYKFNSLKLSSSIGIPLNFQKHNYRTAVLPKISVNAFRNYGLPSQISDDDQFRVDFLLNISKVKLQPRRSVVPDNSTYFNFRIYNIQDPDDYLGATFSYTYYLPSFFKNHSWGIRLGGLYNSSEIPDLNFPDINSSFYYARGHEYKSDKKMLGGIKVNYSFPLLYPDLAVSKFIFFKRIRTNLYFDMDRYNVTDESSWQTQRSVGVEFYFDNVYFRMFELPLGIGLDYLMDVPDDSSRFNIRLLLGF